MTSYVQILGACATPIPTTFLTAPNPNQRSVTANMKMTEVPDRREMLAILQHGDGLQLDMALKTTAQCGMIALEMLETIYGAKFELLGIRAAMLDLRRTGI